MAEQRGSATAAALLSTKPAHADSEIEFLTRLGTGDLLRGALIKLLEARPDDQLGFLADHFKNQLQEKDAVNGAPGGQVEQRLLGQACWHLGLVNHSQRSAFNNNVTIAYHLLSSNNAMKKRGLKGKLYTALLSEIGKRGTATETSKAFLLKKIQCQDHVAVPFEVFRHGVLTCFVFEDYVCKSRLLFQSILQSTKASRGLCHAILGTLQDALEATDCHNPARYLEASSQISPCRLAQAMDQAQASDGLLMTEEEFLNEAAMMFISRVKSVS
ncbi:tubulin polyglutamylase complex subunit 1 [Erpetoichthys calabaricus]|uniref:Tubulin polyglutamylase complex subunit 1-like C-terminal domain-containing protein n=1 Tax=Erpetoichthys calabaricus TaxID=27687 RepID=A0A8C4STW4_ERPCA|nr:tubulin polyglutamylase complex subunit 1 [Erpetoichthys calabaricus]